MLKFLIKKHPRWLIWGSFGQAINTCTLAEIAVDDGNNEKRFFFFYKSCVWLDKVWKRASCWLLKLTHEQSLSLGLHWAGRTLLRQALLLLAAGHHGRCRRLLWQEITTKKKVVFFSQALCPFPHYPGPLTGRQSLRLVVSEWFIPRQIKFSCARLACNDLSCSARGWRRGNGTAGEGVGCCTERKMWRERTEWKEQKTGQSREEQNNRHFPRIGPATFFSSVS